MSTATTEKFIPSQWAFLIECNESGTKPHGLSGKRWYWTCSGDEKALGFSTSHKIGNSSGAQALNIAIENCKKEIRNTYPQMQTEIIVTTNPRDVDPAKRKVEDLVKKYVNLKL